jgi:hypothetical protein
MFLYVGALVGWLRRSLETDPIRWVDLADQRFIMPLYVNHLLLHTYVHTTQYATGPLRQAIHYLCWSVIHCDGQLVVIV